MDIASWVTGITLAIQTIVAPTPLPTPVIVPTDTSVKPAVSFSQLALASPTPTPVPKKTAKAVLGAATDAPPLRKKNLTVAVLGDSMVDTLGPGVPHLKNALNAQYPQASFTVLNYGVGGTNIDYGLERLSNDYTYLGSNIPALVTQNPDIVVVESFAYNPYPNNDPGNLERHWLTLAGIINKLKQHLPGVKIIIAATIAPNSKVFCDGAPGLAFSPEDKQKRTTVIKQYLESTVKFAKGEHIPLADAYHASLNGQGDGKTEYINAGDHIHPSDAGKKLFAQKVAEALSNYRLF